MKGNAASFLPLLMSAWMVSGAPMVPAQFQNNGLFIIPNQSQPQQAASPPFTIENEGDLLEFLDGSMLHGELKRIDTASGIHWESPAAKNLIDLRPGHIDSIRFAHAESATVSPTAHLRFANGDDVLGSVTSLDNDRLGFSAWFGRQVIVPRASVQSITFLSSNYTLLYDGPGDADGWIVGSHNPESWILRDGAFISSFPGMIGRDFKLTNSSTIEFDVECSEGFDLLVGIYSDSVDRMDYSSYLLQLSRTEVNLRHVEPATGGPPRSLGSAPLNFPPGKDKIHVTIQANKAEGTVAVYVDNVLVKRWKDEEGFGATGGGICFQQQAVFGGGVLKLSNITVSEWSGRYEPETAAVATNVDVIRFINHDQAAGKIAGIDQGKITLDLGGTLLQIPIQRVTQINFAATETGVASRGPWQVRAHFPRGGSISFQLEKWSATEVSGRSDIFGTLAFQPGQIRQLEFNLGHEKTAPPTGSDSEFEELDE